jgi:hypothetical protein
MGDHVSIEKGRQRRLPNKTSTRQFELFLIGDARSAMHTLPVVFRHDIADILAQQCLRAIGSLFVRAIFLSCSDEKNCPN